jgi:hypothetical protein
LKGDLETVFTGRISSDMVYGPRDEKVISKTLLS